jgi:hypothetical protein
MYMPKKIIERTVIDEDDSVEGSEYEYNPEEEIKALPKPITKPKTKTKPKKERNEDEEKQVEENKKKRVENATKARLAKLEEDKIKNAVQQRLLEEKRKIKEHQQMQKNFELSVETVVERIMKAKYQPQKEYKPRKGRSITDTETASDFEVKPQKQYKPKVKPLRQIEQQEPQEMPPHQQPIPQQYPNFDNMNNFRNLFM